MMLMVRAAAAATTTSLGDAQLADTDTAWTGHAQDWVFFFFRRRRRQKEGRREGGMDGTGCFSLHLDM